MMIFIIEEHGYRHYKVEDTLEAAIAKLEREVSRARYRNHLVDVQAMYPNAKPLDSKQAAIARQEAKVLMHAHDTYDSGIAVKVGALNG